MQPYTSNTPIKITSQPAKSYTHFIIKVATCIYIQFINHYKLTVVPTVISKKTTGLFGFLS